MKMAIRDDTKEQNKAADEAARTARTVTDEAARAARAGADVLRSSTETARAHNPKSWSAAHPRTCRP